MNEPKKPVGTFPASTQPRDLVGKKYPVEIQKVVDPETGARVTRYVHATGRDTVFYYSSPYITADGKKLVFMSSVSGKREIHSINLAAGEPFSVQLTQGSTSLPDHPCVDVTRNLVFYYSGRSVMRTDIDTLKTDAIYEMPEGTTPLGLSSNGKYVAFSFHYAMDPGKPIAWPRPVEARPQLFLRPMTLIVAVDLDTLVARMVWGDYAFLGHVEVTPFDKDLLHFGDQSAPNRQSEAYVVPVGWVEDKKPLQLFENNRQRLIYVGHTWFTQDGWLAGQMMEYTGVHDRWNHYTDTVGFDAIIWPDGTNMRRARFPGQAKPIHCHAAYADSWWVGDTMPLPRVNKTDPGMMCLIRNYWESQETELIPLYRHDNKKLHAHPWINNAEDKIVFAGEYQDRSAIHVLDLKAFLADKHLTTSPAANAPVASRPVHEPEPE